MTLNNSAVFDSVADARKITKIGAALRITMNTPARNQLPSIAREEAEAEMS
jgi:hypothetical protein